MEGWGKLQFYALRPYRIVVVFAVQAEIVHPRQIWGKMRGLARECRNRPPHERCNHHNFEAKPRHMFEFFNCLPWRMHWYTSSGGHPVRVLTKDIGVVIVEGATDRAAQFVLLDMRSEQTLARIQHNKIESHL